MTNISHMPVADPIRQARADFVADAIELDERSRRFVASKIGLNPSSLGDRLKGRVAFTAEDIEGIAHVLKRDPVDFYREYLEAKDRPKGSPDTGAKGRTTDYGSADSNVVDLTDRIRPSINAEDGELATVTSMWA